MKALLDEYNDILEKYGHYILIVKQNKKRKCSCYDNKTQSASRDCLFCYGLGYLSVIEKHIVRDIDTGVPQTLPLLPTAQLYGDLAVPTRAYFFRREVDIALDDLIIEVDWNGNIPVYVNRGIYEVSHIDPAKFEKGELIFNKVYVKDEPILKEIRGFRIVQDSGKAYYEIAEKKGDKI